MNKKRTGFPSMEHLTQGTTAEEKGKRRRKGISLFLTALLLFNTLSSSPLSIMAKDESASSLCKHHSSHNQDCGFAAPAENSEGTPCTWNCQICPIEELITALPDEITEENATSIKDQLEKILALYAELSQDEQGQIDLSRCQKLQEQLDGAHFETQQAAATLNNVQIFNGNIQTQTFTVDETVTVITKPEFTGQSTDSSTKMKAGLTEPASNQMALFVNRNRVSEPVEASEDGTYTMSVLASDILSLGNIEPGPVNLTAKFIGNDSMANAEATAEITITALAKIEKKDGSLTYTSFLADAFRENYDGSTITLLCDIEQMDPISVYGSFVLDLNGYRLAYKNDSFECIKVNNSSILTIKNKEGTGTITAPIYAISVNGTLILEGGKFLTFQSQYGTEHYGAVVANENSQLIVTGESVSISRLATRSPNISLSSGTYDTIFAREPLDLKDFLAEGCAYYKDNQLLTPDKLSGEELTGPVTVKKCAHDSEDLCTYTLSQTSTTHEKTCQVCNSELVENCSYIFNGNIGTCQKCQSLLTVTVTGDESLIYTGNSYRPAVAVTIGDFLLTNGTDYTVEYGENINASEGIITIESNNETESKNAKWRYEHRFTIAPASLTIKASDQTITYGDNISAGTGTVSITGLQEGDALHTISLTPSTSSVPGGTLTPSSPKIQNSKGQDVTDNYQITFQSGNLTIEKAEGVLNIPQSSLSKTFGDESFSLGCSTNGDGKIIYTSSNENVASVSKEGMVQIQGAGETVITATLQEGANYSGGATQSVTLKVAKAAAPTLSSRTQTYTNAGGSRGALTIDVEEMLPADRGQTTYSLTKTDSNSILSDVSVNNQGSLRYTVLAGKAVGDTASITVTAEMANYETASFTINLSLVAKKTVTFQNSVSIEETPVYGQTLSNLKLSATVFVETGTDTRVPGTLAWKNGTTVLTPEIQEAQWIFQPEDPLEYEEATGTIQFTVKKATPQIELPVLPVQVYDPSRTLNNVALTGGKAVWTVGQTLSEVHGTWSWEDGLITPVAGNSGYKAVFTPTETENYNQVECLVVVKVNKAVPYIASSPAASKITYNDTLGSSLLSGGSVVYGNGTGQAGNSQTVSGFFKWKDTTTKPGVQNSSEVRCPVVFIPADSQNYASVETEIPLEVTKNDSPAATALLSVKSIGPDEELPEELSGKKGQDLGAVKASLDDKNKTIIVTGIVNKIQSDNSLNGSGYYVALHLATTLENSKMICTLPDGTAKDVSNDELFTLPVVKSSQSPVKVALKITNNGVETAAATYTFDFSKLEISDEGKKVVTIPPQQSETGTNATDITSAQSTTLSNDSITELGAFVYGLLKDKTTNGELQGKKNIYIEPNIKIESTTESQESGTFELQITPTVKVYASDSSDSDDKNQRQEIKIEDLHEDLEKLGEGMTLQLTIGLPDLLKDAKHVYVHHHADEHDPVGSTFLAEVEKDENEANTSTVTIPITHFSHFTLTNGDSPEIKGYSEEDNVGKTVPSGSQTFMVKPGTVKIPVPDGITLKDESGVILTETNGVCEFILSPNQKKTITAFYTDKHSSDNTSYTFQAMGGTGSSAGGAVKPAVQTQTMYRVYNPNNGEHLFTANRAEADYLIRLGWKEEGRAWSAPVQSDTPVFRVYNPNSGEHFYTTDIAEKNHLASIGWNDEGIGWYSDDQKGVPVYRLFNPNARDAGSHHYTTSEGERNALSSIGWHRENIGWYGIR